jgi:GT2 family glycosyltransferase
MPPACEPIIDVIVPVHNQRELVEACLASVLEARNQAAFELVVIDDASTDAALKAALARLAHDRRITLLENERNLGFTRSVNRGMRLHSGRDVVLLNSDTLVFGDWIDRLRRAAHACPRIGTANPLTNGSHISGYPFRRADGQVTFEIGDAALDALAAEANTARRVEVHYTVGFCIYIRRAVLDDVGLFDAEHFPVGYGEEADFCYRTRRVGWRHVVTGDVFVRHWEGQSFGERKARLMAHMFEVFSRLHPDIGANDRDFEARDPVRPLREALDLARLRRILAGQSWLPCREADTADATGAPGLVFDGEPGRTLLAARGWPSLPNLPAHRLPDDMAAFNRMLARLSVTQLRFEDGASLARFAALARGRAMDLGLAVELGVAKAVV